jgi:transglutaminase-like putative cysteine protease
MIYEVKHRTTYKYEETVSIAHHLARLTPCQSARQSCEWHKVVVDPKPVTESEHMDYFGNKVLFFAISEAHRHLTVTSSSRVQVDPLPAIDGGTAPPWESVRNASRSNQLSTDTEAGEFSYNSPLISTSPLFADYALQSFTVQRSILEAATDLNARLHREFAFDPTATDVATPVDKAFQQRRGVCQDFAHVFIACVRSLLLPARYVSGYLETVPPPGKPRLAGADASHAWASVWCGAEIGWVDFDPTNNCQPSERHITVAQGRDFFDVSPLRGVVYGTGEHTLDVAVDVIPVTAPQKPGASPARESAFF